MRHRPAKFGRLGAAATQPVGTLDIEFLVNDGAQRAMSSLRVVMKPHATHPCLWHARTSEFFLLLKGTARGVIGGKARRLKAGDYVHMPPRTPHEFRAGRTGVEALVIFSPAMNFKSPDIVLSSPKGRH